MARTILTFRRLLVAALLLLAATPVRAGEDLTRIRLPPGFAISVFAHVPGARSLAVDPKTGTVFVGTRRLQVFIVTPSGVAAFADALAFHDPNGVCLAPDGTLYIVERNRIRAFPAANGDKPAIDVVAEGMLIPPEEASSFHAARVCRVGPDGALYVTVGQPHNIPSHEQQALYARVGIGAILRFAPHGAGYDRSIYATGIRNSVGLDFNPRDGTLWFTDNQVDMMGDDIPPGELNRAIRAGQNFGFPWFGGGHVRTHEYAAETPPEDVVFPQVEMVAHAADLGMTFYRGRQFPAAYRGAIFSAQHGSWNRTVPVGARLMVTFLKPDGTADHAQVFADGWLDPVAHRYTGRPVDVAELADGSLIVSDDYAGLIYRITYGGH